MAQGKVVYDDNCAACHGLDGQGGPEDLLVGGAGMLASGKPIKTVGRYWPLPPFCPTTLGGRCPFRRQDRFSDDETCAVVAYILNLKGIWAENATLDKASLPKIRMPNRGCLPAPEFRNMKNSR